MNKKRLESKDVTLSMVQFGTYGCNNCLWASCECEKGSKFVPDTYRGEPTCKAYTYYD